VVPGVGVPPSGKTSPGQVAFVPEQKVALWVAVAGRQMKLLEANTSAGQFGELPVHCSDTSQLPAEARQVTELESRMFDGQTPELPVQNSSASQSPAEARQTVPVGRVAQVPLRVAPCAVEQASHAPALHAELQQTPSVQKPELHCEPSEHEAPFEASGGVPVMTVKLFGEEGRKSSAAVPTVTVAVPVVVAFK
jgi:hypothetical protein